MRRRKLTTMMLLVFAIMVMTSATAFAYEDEFEFAFDSYGYFSSGFSDNAKKTDEVNKARLDVESVLTSGRPVIFAVYHWSIKTSPVTNYVTGDHSGEMEIPYTADVYKEEWYRLFCRVAGYNYAVTASGTWRP